MIVVARQKQWVLPVTVGTGLVAVVGGAIGFVLLPGPFWFMALWSVLLVGLGGLWLTISIASWLPRKYLSELLHRIKWGRAGGRVPVVLRWFEFGLRTR